MNYVIAVWMVPANLKLKQVGRSQNFKIKNF